MSVERQIKVPSDVGAKLRVALVHHREGRLQEAVEIYQSVVRRMPGHAETLLSLGAALLGLGRHSEAVVPLEKAFLIRSEHPDTCFSLAEAYRASGRIEDAYTIAMKGLKGNPDYLAGHMAAADALLDLGRHDEARVEFENILLKAPDNIQALAKIGAFHYHTGEFRQAEKKLLIAAHNLPEDAEVHWHLASLYLSERRWEEGWPLYFWRWKMAKKPSPETLINLPVWNGENIAGKNIVVWGEQGLGDELMFSTCLPDLLDKAQPGLCVLVCDQRLVSIFKRTFSNTHVLGIDRQSTGDGLTHMPVCDFQIAAGGLPGILRKSDANFPVVNSLALVDPKQALRWRERLDTLGPGLKVGVAWRGGTLERFKRTKSSVLTEWRQILEIGGVQFVNLQYGNCHDDLKSMKNMGIIIHNFDDLDAIAAPDEQMALISELDLVIQTSNASAHMAGILGVPVWNIIPYVADWRWGRETEACLWYASMRLFRQSKLGEWNAVLSRAAAELRNLASQDN